VVEGAVLKEDVTVGPFSHLREGTRLARGVHIGNFAEVKNARLGRDAKMGHFGYVGDAQVGDEVNIGAGTVTCNFDGVRKHRTVIGKGALIGSDTMLVAPVKVGDGATTGAGAVVTRDVPPDSVAVGVPARARRKRRVKGG
jgi:bifunctional UDP-N-acetylglucosamine pyrophosphorylase/glucosamine-1-phosphate N-acetyltransferase